MSRSNLEITPSNVLSDGKISFRRGNPVIQFLIGAQERHLIGKSVRFCGKFRCRLSDTDGAGAFVGSTGDGAELSIDSRLGVYGCIQQVVIRSAETHQVIEHIRHYNRMMASYLPAVSSEQDAITHNFTNSLQFPNYQASKVSVVNCPSQVQGNSFCLPLVCGLLNGVSNIPLSADTGLKGLLIEVHLDSDSNVLFSQSGSLTNLADASYELSDVKLVAEVLDDTAGQQKENTFEYNSISSYFTSLNSTNGVVNFNLGLSRVLGVFANFVQSSKINNLAENGMTTMPLINALSGGSALLARTKKLVFTRGGMKFPLEYDIDYLGKDGQTYDSIDAQVMRNFLNAIKKFSSIDRLQTSVRSTNYTQDHDPTPDGRGIVAVDGGQAYGVGIAYDVVSDAGVDFSQMPFGLQLTSELTSDNPNAMFLFVHSKQTLVFSPAGLQVMS